MKRTWLIFSQAVTVLLAALLVVQTLKPQWLGRISASTAAQGSVSVLEAPKSEPGALPVGSFRQAAQKAAAAVVSINTSQKRKPRTPAEELWFRHFNDGSEDSSGGLGSGVIVSSSGYILTNNHVVEGADDIEVVLNDGRHAKAKIIGTDPDTDLAVLKIELDRLPVIVMGSSDALQVGDQVLAIGNPFGVGQTVTSGIVSALGRNQLGINTFENFIQTDAAINPGNSGGALVDVNGNLLGINTAIYSRSGGSMGIGFAIPVSTGRQVLEGLVKEGQITRGWIGVEPQDLTPEIATHMGIDYKTGVVITGLLKNGPAATAGMLPGDMVSSVAGHPVTSVSELLAQVAVLKPGVGADLAVVRKGQTLTLKITPGSRPKPKVQSPR